MGMKPRALSLTKRRGLEVVFAGGSEALNFPSSSFFTKSPYYGISLVIYLVKISEEEGAPLGGMPPLKASYYHCSKMDNMRAAAHTPAHGGCQWGEGEIERVTCR